MRKQFPWLVLAASLLALPVAQASVQLGLALTELVAQSDYVVLASAEHAEARRAGRVIVTDVTLKVITSLKGPALPGSQLTATHLGGSVGEVGLHVPGAPMFKLGQNAIVFLQRPSQTDQPGLSVTGMGQGVLPITGKGSTAQVDTAGTGGAKLMQRDPSGAIVDMPASTSPRKRVLSDVMSEIDRLVQKPE